MAQFTAQGRLKPLLNSDGMSFGRANKNPRRHHHKALDCRRGGEGGRLRFTVSPSLKLPQLPKRKLGRGGTRVNASSSSPPSSSANRSKHFKKEKGIDVSGDDVIDEIMEDAEFEKDELASFRGLVLDISYRPVNVVCWKRAICLEFMEKVTACAQCNSKKGQKTVEEANMKLMKVPKAPKDYDIFAIPLTTTAMKVLRMRNGTPEEWRQYLSKSAP